jgi:adenylosuccinate synthase
LGLQWGDEAKAKVVDILADEADAVVRYQGGANAGHTVVVNGEKYVLHLIPSGILRPGKLCVVANGVAVDLDAMATEIAALREKGVEVGDNLRVSDRAQIVFPYHKQLDELREQGSAGIGTTKRGIGPCYGDKHAYRGVRVGELLEPDSFRRRMKVLVEERNRLLTTLYGADPVDCDALCDRYLAMAKDIEPFICDTSALLNDMLDGGKHVLFEGAQGALLDVDHGTYPFSTSSSTTVCGIPSGAGIAPSRIGHVLGVMKAYTTRVGGGPYPTELTDETGAFIREQGHEFGATTGRPRRCGWLDMVACRYALRLNGADGIALTKLDVLTGLDEIRVCTAYEIDGERTTLFPATADTLARAKPVWESHPGWSEDISGAKDTSDLPSTCLAYLEWVQQLAATPIAMVSVGPERKQFLWKERF